MQQVELQETSGALSALVAQVEAGDEIVLMRAGKAIARIVSESGRGEQLSELTPEQQARARSAIANIAALANRLELGPFNFEEFKRDRNEGRL